MNLNRAVWLSLLILLSGCVQKMESIKEDVALELNADEGYLLIAVDTNLTLEKIVFSGRKRIALTSADLQAGSNFILLTIPAGDYQIEQVYFGRRLRLDDFEDDLWQFKVNKDSISYVGHLTLQSRSYFWRVRSNIELLNKSSLALEYMEENFANIVNSKTMVYAGPGEDSFFEVVGRNNTQSEAVLP